MICAGKVLRTKGSSSPLLKPIREGVDEPLKYATISNIVRANWCRSHTRRDQRPGLQP